jgi:hypothetical protein
MLFIQEPFQGKIFYLTNYAGLVKSPATHRGRLSPGLGWRGEALSRRVKSRFLTFYEGINLYWLFKKF